MYADYTYYTDSFLGTAITAADFPRLALRASDFIDYYTHGKSKTFSADADLVDPLAKACCAIAEQMQADEQAKAVAAKAASAALAATGGEVKSETVGSWSQSYTTSADYAKQSQVEAVKNARLGYAAIATEYLANTGLLYRGC